MLRRTESKSNVKIGNASLYVDPFKKSLRKGRDGKAIEAGRFYASLSKGEARKLRKRLRGEGLVSIAAVSRCA